MVFQMMYHAVAVGAKGDEFIPVVHLMRPFRLRSVCMPDDMVYFYVVGSFFTMTVSVGESVAAYLTSVG